MDKEALKEKFLEFWDKVKEVSARVWEETVDRAYDLWDSFKHLPQNAQYAIAGGAGGLLLIIILTALLYTPTLPVIAVQNTSGATGEGNWIAIKNNSPKRTLKKLNVIMDDKYIFYIEQIGPGEQVKIINSEFYQKLPGNKFGGQVGQNITGSKVLILCGRGKAEIPLGEKKRGLFGG